MTTTRGGCCCLNTNTNTHNINNNSSSSNNNNKGVRSMTAVEPVPIQGKYVDKAAAVRLKVSSAIGCVETSHFLVAGTSRSCGSLSMFVACFFPNA